VEFNFSVSLPDVLAQELLEAARECRCSPKIFAAQSVESVLASRRLPKVTPGVHGPRIWTAEVGEAEPKG
jgi:hypothetical protein